MDAYRLEAQARAEECRYAVRSVHSHAAYVAMYRALAALAIERIGGAL